MTAEQLRDGRRRARQAALLYERYGKPLEADHWGEYVAISAAGHIVLGKDMLEVLDRSVRELGPGADIFRIGPRVIGKWR